MRYRVSFWGLVFLMGTLLWLSTACSPDGAQRSASLTAPSVNKAIVARYYEDVWNQGNPDALAAICSGGLVDHVCLATQDPGLEGFEKVIRAVQASFSESHFTVDELISEGDKVTARWTFDATFAATGLKTTFSGHETWRLEDGMIVERWGNLDFLSLMSQIFATAGRIPELPKTTGFRPREAEVAAVRMYYDDIFNQRKADSFESAFADDFVDHSPDPGQSPDLAGFQRSVEGFTTAFRESKFRIDKLEVKEDKIWVNWTYQGIFPASDAPVEFTGREVWIARDGKIKERWGEYDLQALVDQIGFIASPEYEERPSRQ